jgi:predicted ATP-grasp superfamily ATP-dependent carboligase
MDPRADHLLSSYTYIDRSHPLFHFTKKVIADTRTSLTHHLTDWDREVAELGLRFLTGINFRGLANVEFKRDVRDGRLKLVECNARFTAPQELFVRCGLDTASLVYNHLVGLPMPRALSYKLGIRLWYPIRDFWAYRQLRAMNELTFREWLKSVWHWQAFPFFQPTDPLPPSPATLAIRRRLYSTR